MAVQEQEQRQRPMQSHRHADQLPLAAHGYKDRVSTARAGGRGGGTGAEPDVGSTGQRRGGSRDGPRRSNAGLSEGVPAATEAGLLAVQAEGGVQATALPRPRLHFSGRRK